MNDLSACVLDGTAYSRILQTTYPALKLKLCDNTTHMVQGVVDGSCHAMIERASIVEWAASKHWFGGCAVEAIGETFYQGQSLLGVGVRGGAAESPF